MTTYIQATLKKYNLPDLPPAKTYYNDQSTPEHDVIIKCLQDNVMLTVKDEETLAECVHFYDMAFQALKKVPLSNISLAEANDLTSYMNFIFSLSFPIQNDFQIKDLYRVSIIDPTFIEKGKVRDPKYISYPPLKIVKQRMAYGRANTFENTVLYGAFSENVAVRETKPEKGSSIIISHWKPKDERPFNAYPITNANVVNEEVQKATTAFRKTIANYHPLFSKILDLNIGFLASEFTKQTEIKSRNRLEYLYSAFFADQTFRRNPTNLDIPDFDLIFYPSVAFNHKESNIAMHPDAVERMKIIKVTEYSIEETHYNDENTTLAPAKLKYIREAFWIEKNQIIWEDD